MQFFKLDSLFLSLERAVEDIGKCCGLLICSYKKYQFKRTNKYLIYCDTCQPLYVSKLLLNKNHNHKDKR